MKKTEGCCSFDIKSKYLGVIAIIMGLLALMAPGITGFSITLIVGFMVTVTGIARLIWAFEVGSFGRGLLLFLIGILTLVVGIAMIVHPLFASGIMALFLATYFIADGILEVIAGIVAHKVSGYGWYIFGGIVSVLLGLIIMKQFPLSGDLAIGILFGIKMFLIGLIMIAGGSASKA